MALKDTIKQMKTLLSGIAGDLEKAEAGNKAASQRVRTGTIRLEKSAKNYRKESIQSEKSGGFRRKPKATASKKVAARPVAVSKAKKMKPPMKKRATAKIERRGR